jgi:hypothetical protein
MKSDKIRNSHEGDGGRVERGDHKEKVGEHGYDYKMPHEKTNPKYYGGDHRRGKMSGKMD